jgi:iron complex outermembrane receptor protein
MTISIRRTYLVGTAVILAGSCASLSDAAAPIYRIPAGSLADALRAFAIQSNDPVVAASDLIAGKSSNAVSGAMPKEQALKTLLAGTGLHGETVAGSTIIRPDKPAARRDDDIVVTGTRIHGSAPIGSPVTVITRQTIQDSGRATIANYIDTLPQNYGGGPSEGAFGITNRNNANENQSYGSTINLRGLGAESTLVLFDGNRPALGGTAGAFVDTSLIPSTAIDRIEILSDGASAIYGTDAVAGVVNIRFRDRLNGFETQLYSGVASDGATSQFQVAQAAGKRWDTGGVMIAGQYDHRGHLSGADRSFATEDLTPYGGPDYRLPYATPGNIIADDGSIYAIPAGQNGRGLTAAQLLPGQTNLLDESKVQDLLPVQTTVSLYAAGDQQLGAGISFYARLLYAHRRFSAINPLASFEPYTVPVTNPFYVDPTGSGQPVTVDYGFAKELGPERQTGTVDGLTTSEGIKGHLGTWTLDASGAYGRQVEQSLDVNNPSYDRVEAALADTDPATSLNLFGDGTANNPATLDKIRGYFKDYSRYSVWSANLRADGTILALPAGPVKLAVGVEHRDERFTGRQSDNLQSDTLETVPSPGTPGHRTINAMYGELSIPILGPQADRLPGRLDLSIAGRADWYSDVGRTINPKAGLRWEPVSGLALRGSFGTSFRAPGFTENLGAAQNFYEAAPVPDPQSPTGATNVIAELGYAPDIKPEKATSWTIGADIKPPAVPGLSITGTYFTIAYRDRIGTANFDYTSFFTDRSVYAGLTQEHPDAATVAAFYANPNFINPFGIAAADIGAIINLETLNLSRVTTRGVDFDIGYSHPLGAGTLSAGIAGTRLLEMDQRLTNTAPRNDVLGTLFYPVKLKVRGRVGWAEGGFDATAFVNYVDGYTNQLADPAAHVASWTTIDGQIGYRFGERSPFKGARLGLGATNLFNRKPPYVENHSFDSTMAYDPGQASAIGRLISVQIGWSW